MDKCPGCGATLKDYEIRRGLCDACEREARSIALIQGAGRVSRRDRLAISKKPAAVRQRAQAMVLAGMP